MFESVLKLRHSVQHTLGKLDYAQKNISETGNMDSDIFLFSKTYQIQDKFLCTSSISVFFFFLHYWYSSYLIRIQVYSLNILFMSSIILVEIRRKGCGKIIIRV